MKPRFWQTFGRSWRLRCPRCGEGRIAKNWYTTHDACPRCGLDFQVEGGFYLGSIYLNYGLLALLTVLVAMPLVAFGYVSPLVAIATGSVVFIFVALWFWRYARSLWLGLGYYLDHNVRGSGRAELPGGEAQDRHAVHLRPDESSQDYVCPFCQTRFRFAESKSHSWQVCAFCGEKVFLTPVR